MMFDYIDKGYNHNLFYVSPEFVSELFNIYQIKKEVSGSFFFRFVTNQGTHKILTLCHREKYDNNKEKNNKSKIKIDKTIHGYYHSHPFSGSVSPSRMDKFMFRMICLFLKKRFFLIYSLTHNDDEKHQFSIALYIVLKFKIKTIINFNISRIGKYNGKSN